MVLTKTNVIWIDGKFVPWDEARVHVLSHSLHYGTGVFEGMRVYDTAQGPMGFRFRDHIQRLFDSAFLLRMEMSHSQQDFMNFCKETVRVNEVRSCYVRPLVFRGYGEMGLNPLSCPVNCVIAVWPWETYLGKDGLTKGVKVMTSSYSRHHVNSMLTKAKVTGAYVNSSLAKMEAVEHGYPEAIMLDADGLVCEGTGENVFSVTDREVTTVPTYASILGGITRDSVIRIARDLGYEVRENPVTRDELLISDEVFFTGTAAEITPVVEIDKRKIGSGQLGEITKNIQNKFFEVISARDSRYESWLDMI